jgi:hypothetical protein
MSNLMNSIKSLYGQISEEEVILAEGNLLGMFKALERIEVGLKQNLTETDKDLSNGRSNENLGSANRVYKTV